MFHRLVAGAVHHQLAIAQSQQFGRNGQQLCAVCDHHNQGAAQPQRLDGLQQCRNAGVIQIGVGLVQHHELRISQHCACQGDALTLAAGQHSAVGPDRSLIPIRQLEDHLVGASQLRRGNDGSARGIAKAADVLCHGSLDQAVLLRQVAHIGAQMVLVPCINVGTVEPHHALRCRPDAHEQARQRGLSSRAGANDGDDVTRRHAQVQAAQRCCLASGRDGRDVLQNDMALRLGQLHRLSARRNRLQQVDQAGCGLLHRHPLLPGTDQLLHGRQCTAEQDAGGDHCSRRDLVIDRQPGAQTEDARLRREAHRLAGRANAAAEFARA